MPKPKQNAVKGNSVNLIEPERFPRVREEFAKRGLGGMSLSAMLRIVVDEWLRKRK